MADWARSVVSDYVSPYHAVVRSAATGIALEFKSVDNIRALVLKASRGDQRAVLLAVGGALISIWTALVVLNTVRGLLEYARQKWIWSKIAPTPSGWWDPISGNAIEMARGVQGYVSMHRRIHSTFTRPLYRILDLFG